MKDEEHRCRDCRYCADCYCTVKVRIVNRNIPNYCNGFTPRKEDDEHK